MLIIARWNVTYVCCWRSSSLLLVEFVVAYIDRCGGLSLVIAYWWLCLS
jgi:hypothetical protein